MNDLDQTACLYLTHKDFFNQAVFNNPIIGVAFLTKSGNFLEVNQRLLEMLDISTKEEILTKNWKDFTVIEQSDKFESIFSDCLQKMESNESVSVTQNYYLQNKTGFSIFCRVHIVSLSLSCPLQILESPAFLIFVENITEENIYKQMFQVNPAPKILVLPESGVIVDANYAASLFYGYSVVQLKNMTVYDLCILPKETVEYHIQNTVYSPQGFTFESQHRLADGSSRDVEVSNACIRIGKQVYLYSIIQDVTVKNRAQTALSQEVHRHDTLLKSMREGFHVINSEGKILEVNQACCDLTGYSRAELLNLSVKELDCYLQPDVVLLQKIQTFFLEESVTFETMWKRKDQIRISIEIKTSVFFSGSAALLFCTARDITERKKAELALRENEACLREITNTIAEGLYVLDERGQIVFSNPEVSRLLGWTQEELYQRDAHGLFHHIKNEGKNLLHKNCQIDQVVLEGNIFRGVASFVQRNGQILPVSVVATPMIRENKIVGSIVTFQDLRELKAAEEEKYQTERRFKKISEALPGVVYQLHFNVSKREMEFGFLSQGARALFDIEEERNLSDLRFAETMEMVVPEDCEKIAKSTQYSAILLQPWNLEFRIRTPKGVHKWIHGHSMPEKDEAGNIVWNGFLVDITKHKEEEEAVWLEREKFKLAIEASEAGYYDHDLQFEHVHIDMHVAQILGYELVDVPQGSEIVSWWLSRIMPDYRDLVCHEYHKLLDKEMDHLVLEYKIKHRSGASRWLRVTSKIITFQNNISHPYDEIVGIILDITSVRRAQEKLEILANYDQLTHLGNRHAFTHYLPKWIEKAYRHNQQFALCFLDLDGFKLVNDQYGHDIGDLLLKEVAKRLNLCLFHPKDTAYRVGGDEFILLIRHQASFKQYLTELANRVIENLSVAFLIGEKSVHIGVSIGIAIYPDHTMEMNHLIKYADSAMYEAKNNGKNTYRFYQESIE